MPSGVFHPTDAERRALALVLRYGWNATAFQTLGGSYAHFFHGEGVVAYVDTGSAWVAAGAPISDPSRLAELALAFASAARRRGRRCCFFGTEQRFVDALGARARSTLVGEQPVWDPRVWPDTLARNAGLREQLRRARAKGVSVEEADPETEGHNDAETRALVEGWLASRGMPPMGFVVSLPSRKWPTQRRTFVARRDGRPVAVAFVVPVPARDGWFLEHLVRGPGAPNGTVELLIDAVMNNATRDGRTWLTLGLAPLAGDVPAALKLARHRTRLLYDFDGLRRFKAKLRPGAWQPVYVSRPAEQGAIVTMVDVLSAFAPGGFVRFGARALARGSRAAIAALAALLVVWIGLLANAPAERWFAGHGGVKWAWVAFDVGLSVGLSRLAWRPSRRLATALAVAASADAILTTFEALTWNVPRSGALDLLIVATACTGPSLAAWMLWGARARLAVVERGHAPSPRWRDLLRAH